MVHLLIFSVNFSLLFVGKTELLAQIISELPENVSMNFQSVFTSPCGGDTRYQTNAKCLHFHTLIREDTRYACHREQPQRSALVLAMLLREYRRHPVAARLFAQTQTNFLPTENEL